MGTNIKTLVPMYQTTWCTSQKVVILICILYATGSKTCSPTHIFMIHLNCLRNETHSPATLCLFLWFANILHVDWNSLVPDFSFHYTGLKMAVDLVNSAWFYLWQFACTFKIFSLTSDLCIIKYRVIWYLQRFIPSVSPILISFPQKIGKMFHKLANWQSKVNHRLVHDTTSVSCTCSPCQT
jgi:hypothetical protein